MLYTELIIKEKTYKLRLDTRNIISLEKAINKNPIAIFGTTGEKIPEVTEMVNVLFYSLQHFQHGIGLQDAFNIFDEYLQEHTVTDFITEIIEIYKASGLIEKGDNASKN